MPAKDEEFIPTRTSLLGRLKNWDDQESWKEFFDTYWKMLYSVARRAGLSETDAQDVVQEAIVAVAKKSRVFSMTGHRLLQVLADAHYPPAHH